MVPSNIDANFQLCNLGSDCLECRKPKKTILAFNALSSLMTVLYIYVHTESLTKRRVNVSKSIKLACVTLYLLFICNSQGFSITVLVT